jgi:hypothetical protein
MMAANLLATAERGPALVHANNGHLQRDERTPPKDFCARRRRTGTSSTPAGWPPVKDVPEGHVRWPPFSGS